MKWILILTLFQADSVKVLYHYDIPSKILCENKAATEIKKLQMVWPMQVRWRCEPDRVETMSAYEGPA